MSMTCSERIDAAIRLRPPDRVPVVTNLRRVAGRWAGMTTREFLFDHDKAEAALERAFLDIGGWDAVFSLYPHINGTVLKTGIWQIKWPGEDMPPDSDFQYFESEVMKEEDYHLLLEIGGEKFVDVIRSRVHPGITKEKVKAAEDIEMRLLRREIQFYSSHGVPVLVGGHFHNAFDMLVLIRSMERFFLDLRRIPDLVEKAEEVLTEWAIARGREIARATGIPRVRIIAGRGSAAFMHPKMFDRFVLPFWRRMLEAFSRDGITPVMLIGSKCTLNLPQMRGLPPASCVLSLNEETDMFEAKRILGDQQCLMGNVPATMLIFGQPQEITDYSKKLIKEVGAGGGFILNNQAEVPLAAKKENVRAMIEAAKTYGAC